MRCLPAACCLISSDKYEIRTYFFSRHLHPLHIVTVQSRSRPHALPTTLVRIKAALPCSHPASTLSLGLTHPSLVDPYHVYLLANLNFRFWCLVPDANAGAGTRRHTAGVEWIHSTTFLGSMPHVEFTQPALQTRSASGVPCNSSSARGTAPNLSRLALAIDPPTMPGTGVPWAGRL